jgi:hypothetical protein
MVPLMTALVSGHEQRVVKAIGAPAIGNGIHLGAEARVRLPNVDEAIDVGYAFHAANDPALAGSQSQKLALRITEQFLALAAQPDNPAEVPYLACVRGIALSYGRGLSRLKEQFSKRIEHAKEQRKRHEDQLRGAGVSSGTMAALWKLVGAFILGAFGYLFAKVVGAHVVSTDVATTTGTQLPSLIVGGATAFFGRYVSVWWGNRTRDKIARDYDAECYRAFIDYERGKLRAYKQSRTRLCEAWREYAGENYPDTASYQMIMEGDIETRKNLERILLASSITDARRILRIVRGVRRRRRDRQKQAGRPAGVGLAGRIPAFAFFGRQRDKPFGPTLPDE